MAIQKINSAQLHPIINQHFLSLTVQQNRFVYRITFHIRIYESSSIVDTNIIYLLRAVKSMYVYSSFAEYYLIASFFFHLDKTCEH